MESATLVALGEHMSRGVEKITVRYTSADLLRLGLYVTLRSASLKWTLLAVAAVVLWINFNDLESRLGLASLVAIVLTTIVFTAGALVFLLVMIMLSALIRNRRGTAAAEAHTYSVTDAGLFRQSASSDALLKWGGARSLLKNKHAIYVGTSARSYYILPRRYFADNEAYVAFWDSIQRLAPGKQ